MKMTKPTKPAMKTLSFDQLAAVCGGQSVGPTNRVPLPLPELEDPGTGGASSTGN